MEGKEKRVLQHLQAQNNPLMTMGIVINKIDRKEKPTSTILPASMRRETGFSNDSENKPKNKLDFGEIPSLEEMKKRKAEKQKQLNAEEEKTEG